MTRGVWALKDVDRLQGKHDRCLVSLFGYAVHVCAFVFYVQTTNLYDSTSLIGVEKPFLLSLPFVFVSRHFLFILGSCDYVINFIKYLCIPNTHTYILYYICLPVKCMCIP